MRLTKPSIQYIREIDLRFPKIVRRPLATGSSVRALDLGGLKALGQFPRLQALTLYLYEDILARDVEILRLIKNRFGESCRVSVDVHEASFGALEYRRQRPVRISSEIMKEVREWGWAMNGSWELVDANHELWDEDRWIERFRNEFLMAMCSTWAI